MRKIEMWYAACDYIRMTWRAGSLDDEQFSMLWLKCAAAVRATTDSVMQSEMVRMIGYTGWKLGQLFVGRNEQGAMIQASGSLAQAICELALCPDNVSRMDIQATVWLDAYDSQVARSAAKEAQGSFIGRRGRTPRIRHIDGYGGGDTAYIGTRGKNAVVIRIYDKEKESGCEEFASAWRYEAELTDGYARDCYYECIGAGFGEPMIARLLTGYCLMRGVTLALPGESKPFDRRSIPKVATTNERRLAWLRAQVAPSVQRLMLDGVDPSEVMKALGLGV
jgi:hypothetical protein